MPKNTAEEMRFWNAKPRDYRSVINGVRYVPHYNGETGATELWPLSDAYAARRQS